MVIRDASLSEDRNQVKVVAANNETPHYHKGQGWVSGPTALDPGIEYYQRLSWFCSARRLVLIQITSFPEGPQTLILVKKKNELLTFKVLVKSQANSKLLLG